MGWNTGSYLSARGIYHNVPLGSWYLHIPRYFAAPAHSGWYHLSVPAPTTVYQTMSWQRTPCINTLCTSPQLEPLCQTFTTQVAIKFNTRFTISVPNPMLVPSYYTIGTWFSTVRDNFIGMVQYVPYQAVW